MGGGGGERWTEGRDGVSSHEAESTVQAKFFHSTEHRTDDSVNYKAFRNLPVVYSYISFKVDHHSLRVDFLREGTTLCFVLESKMSLLIHIWMQIHQIYIKFIFVWWHK